MNNENKKNFAFGRMNYILMLAGIITLIIGFTLMSLDAQPYGFGFLGLTLGPIIVMVGFIIEFFAIMYRDRATDK